MYGGAVVAQLACARLSEREVPGSIFSDFKVCFEFPLIRVRLRFAIGRVIYETLNSRKLSEEEEI